MGQLGQTSAVCAAAVCAAAVCTPQSCMQSFTWHLTSLYCAITSHHNEVSVSRLRSEFSPVDLNHRKLCVPINVDHKHPFHNHNGNENVKLSQYLIVFVYHDVNEVG